MTIKKKIVWHTEQRKVSELVPYSKNPRILSDKQREDLEASIKKFGLAEIPAINTDNLIIAGHQRLKILLTLGKGNEIIDVRIPNRKLKKKEFEEYLLRSNRNRGSWEYELLKEFDIDFLLDIGFDDTDLLNIWDDVLEIEDDDFEIDKEIDEIHETDIQEGNFFQLGDHFLYCGDSTDLSVIQKLVGKNKIDMIYGDSPYNISLNYDKGLGGKSHYGGNVRDNLSDSDFKDFLKTVISNTLSVAKKDAHIFYWADSRYVGMLQDIYKELYINYKRTCLWIKNGMNLTPQISFNKCYENCLYGIIGEPYIADFPKNLNEILNKEVGTGNATIDDIVDLFDIWLAKRLPGSEMEHPTQKPVTLHEKPLKRCTKIGDCVLDPFGGSGSTMLACEQMKRKSFLVEKSPIFCQLIINRYEKETGIKTKKIN